MLVVLCLVFLIVFSGVIIVQLLVFIMIGMDYDTRCTNSVCIKNLEFHRDRSDRNLSNTKKNSRKKNLQTACVVSSGRLDSPV